MLCPSILSTLRILSMPYVSSALRSGSKRTLKHLHNIGVVLTWRRLNVYCNSAYGDDQIVATFAIGHTRSAWGRDLLRPFLQSDGPRVRWAAALSLGEIKDERARPVLVQTLQEFLPPPYTPRGAMGHDWFEMEQLQVADLPGHWGDPVLVPALHETLERVW